MKRFLLIVIAFFAFASSGLFTHFYNRTDDLSLRYILWKRGFYPYPSEIIPHSILADRDKNRIIQGRTKDEVKNLFPNVHKQSINESQQMYDKELAGRDYLWLGESNVIIFFKDGFAEEISIMKG